MGGFLAAYLTYTGNQRTAKDEQRAAVLQTYIDNMRTLLLNQQSASAWPAEALQVARVQTLTTLRILDPDRNKEVFEFLQDAGLVRGQDAIDLSDADLSGDNLDGADLSGVDLNGANLAGAHLEDADLAGTALFNANLDRADLGGANLSDAALLDARLSDTNLNNANLSDATLTGAFLGDADINNATLTGTSMSDAIMTGVHLDDAHLSGAQLNGADLTGADLHGADLSDTDLLSARISHQQLEVVYSCTEAALPKAEKCPHHPRVTLTYWYTESPAERPVIKKLVEKFEQVHPEIRINLVYKNYFYTETDFENAAEGGVPAAEAGGAPDVLRSDASWVAQFASQGYLLELDPYIYQSLADYLPNSLNQDRFNGHYYGLPQVTDFLALMYNKNELKEAGVTSLPPRTMNDFAADAIKVARNLKGVYGFETSGKSNNAMPFLYAFGGGMLDQDRHILVNDAGSIKGLKFLLSLQNNSAKPMPGNIDFSNAPVSPTVGDFEMGRTAMIFDGPYDISAILTGSAFSKDHNNLGIAAIPACPDHTSTCQAGQTGSPIGGQSYVISASTLHPIEAYTFISFMSSTSSQVEIAQMNHTLPTRISAQNQVSGDQFISEFRRIQSTAITLPSIPQAGYLFSTFDPSVAAALDGVETADTALDEAAAAWKQLLSK